MSLEKKIQQGKSLRKKIQDSKKSCFSSTMDVLPGGKKKLQYIEEKIDLADETIQQLKVLSGNEEYCSLCKRFSQQSAQKSDKKREKRRQKEQRLRNVRRRERNPWKRTLGNLLSLILKSTSSYSGTYHILDGGDFLKPIVTKSNLNIENLNSKNIKPRLHLEPLRELLGKGYVDNDVIEDLQSLVHKLEKKTKRKKKQPPKRKMNPISSYFHKKASTSRGKSQDGGDADSHDDIDEDDNDNIDDGGDDGVGGTN